MDFMLGTNFQTVNGRCSHKKIRVSSNFQKKKHALCLNTFKPKDVSGHVTKEGKIWFKLSSIFGT